MSLYFIIDVNRRVRRLGAPFVNHLHMLNRRGAQCAPAARPEPAQGTAKNRLILRCVGAHCAPLRDNVYQSLDTVRRVVAPYVLAIDRQFSQ